MSDDGVNTGVRNIGRFFLALIPWALAIGVMAWGGVWVAMHEYRAQVAQERRSAQWVASTSPPRSKLKIEVVHIAQATKEGCVQITRVDDDGDSLVIYGRNDCGTDLSYTDWNWELLSPNGTIVAQGDDNGEGSCNTPTRPGDQAECRPFSYKWDERAATLRVWTEANQ